MAITFTNPPRERTSPQVEGTAYSRTHGMADGEHRVLLLAYLPKNATDVGSADPPFSVAGTDGPMKVVGFRYGVKVGETRTVRITFSVPKNQPFLIIPSGRAHPVPYSANGRTVTDDKPAALAL